MKLIKYILPIAFFAAFLGCSDELDKQTATADPTAPVLAAHDAIVVDADNLEATTTFKWQTADFGYSAAVQYSLFAQVGEEGEAVLVGSAYADSIVVKLGDVNRAVIAAGVEAGTEEVVIFTISAAISDSYKKAVSGHLMVNVTTFESLEPVYPEHMYMIGKQFGSWSWFSDDIVELVPVNENPGKFWCVRYFDEQSTTAGDGFKWCSVKDWNGDFKELDNNNGFVIGGNAQVETAGLYLVYIDLTTSTITIESAQVYGMGDCFGGWTAGDYPFTKTGEKMTLTTTGAGELRICISLPSTDWWRTEFVILNGIIEYRGNGGDQERVQVAVGKVVTLDFNAGTGTIQ